MNEETKKHKIVFSIYPNANGYGYVYLDTKLKLLDHGTVRVNPINNIVLLGRIKRLFSYFKPTVVIVVDPNSKVSRVGMRAIKLIEEINVYCEEKDISVFKISRDQIRDTFMKFGVSTRFEISQVLVREFKELELKTPKQRNIWSADDRNMAIFDALSLGLTWLYLND